MTDEFFSYALLGQGQPADAHWVAARHEFLYWYPLDSRHSAHDLIRNHLTFFIFIHTAVFSHVQPSPHGVGRPAAAFWPRQTVSNGFVTMDGKKMSKSMGNILPLRKAIAQFGPDVVRFVVTSTAELEADSDFNQPAAEGVISRLQFLDEQLQKTLAAEKGAPARSAISNAPGSTVPHPHSSHTLASSRDGPGLWFYSRFHRRLLAAPGQYERFELRSLAQAILYDTVNDLQAYLKQSPQADLREFFELWTLLSAPFMPHLAEEFWTQLGAKQYASANERPVKLPGGSFVSFASRAAFPQADETQINDRLEMSQQYVLALREDIAHILKLLKKDKPASITLIVHAAWKEEVRAMAAGYKQMPLLMSAAKAVPELSSRMPQVSVLAARYLKNIGAITGTTLTEEEEFVALRAPSALKLLESEFGAPITIMSEAEAPAALSTKAANALPGKPAIVIA